jgi:hypothetical protein
VEKIIALALIAGLTAIIVHVISEPKTTSVEKLKAE